MACVIFTAPAPEHGEVYCKPAETSSVAVGPHNHTDWIKIAHPMIEDPHDKEFKFDYCNVFHDAHEHAELFFNDSGMQHHIEPWQKPHKGDNVIPCSNFEYRPDYVSVVTQFDLVCSRDVMIAVTQFFHLFGVLWGGIIATKLMEFISPKRLMLLGMFAQIFSGCLTGLVNNYWLHVFFRCTSAICCGQMYTGGQVIFTDITSGKYKTSAVALFEQFWSVGLILLPGVAYYWSSWTYLYIAISCPTVVLIYLYRWIPESPRWLLKNGMIDEAKEVLIEAAEFNGTPDRIPKDLDVLLQAEMECEVPPQPSWFSIWENKRTTINLICCHIGWSIYIMIYYAWLLNIRVYGRQYLEINTVVAAISELCGVFFGYYFIMCTSRKWMWTSLFNMLGGLVGFSIWFLPPDVKGPEKVVLQMCTSMVAKIAVSSTLCLLTTCTQELVSPEKRKVLGYWSTVWARTWLLGAPFIGALGYFYGKFLPQTILATMTFMGGVITSYIEVPRTHPKKTCNDAKYPVELSPEIFTVKL